MTNMRKAVITGLVACAVVSVQAQGLKRQGTGAEDIVPQGWTHDIEAKGDLNKDGIADWVVATKPDFKENMKTRDDGYVYNFNQPILAIYFGTSDGRLQLWRQYPEVLPVDEDETCSHDISLEITDRGVLRITTQLFCSMGGWCNSTNNYSYRYQNGDFFLIGKDLEESRRNTGEVTLVSENYLTWKRQVQKSNFTNDDPPTEKWSKLQKKPLEKLGSRGIGDE